jgi:hypothetical protein
MIMEKAESKTKGTDGKTVRAREEVKETKDEDGKDEGNYVEAYRELVAVVERETKTQAHWIKG